MSKMIASELLKYKRSFAGKLALIAPMFFGVYGLVLHLYLPEQASLSWDLLLSMVFNWWPVLFVPLGIALLCTLAENREKRAGNYRSIYSNNISLSKLWFSKIVAVGLYMLLSSVVLMIVVLALGYWKAEGTLPLLSIVEASLLIWLLACSLIPLHLFLAARFGVFAGLISGVAAMLLGVLSAPESYWLFVPWSWATRLMAPVIGVHPNGVTLSPGDPLLDASVIPIGIGASLLFLVLSALITGFWFARREVR
jgi:lantibiotic protection ABC transporter permease subunit, MutE/EpiE family